MNKFSEAFKPFLQEILPLVLVVSLAAPIFTLRIGAFGSDGSEYLVLGQRLAMGQGYIAPADSIHNYVTSGRSPMFALLLALSFLLFGASASSALLVTKVSAFGTIVVMYLLLRRVYDRRTGLAASALVVTSSFMVSFPAHIYVDQVMCFFMLLGLYLAIKSLDRHDLVLAIIAGMATAVGFLVKELAFIWVPLPLYLVLHVSKWRKWRSLYVLIAYGLGFGILTGSWWLYFYQVTGRIFLLSRFLGVLPKVFSNRILGVFGIAIFGALLFFYIGRELNRKYKTFQWLSREKLKRLWFLGPTGTAWLFCLVITWLMSLGLISRTGVSFSSLTQVPLRLQGFLIFVEKAAQWQPLFDFLLPAVGVILIASVLTKRHPIMQCVGNQVMLWIFLASMPLVLLGLPGQSEITQRYGMPLFWLAYMILGRGFVLALYLVGTAFSYAIVRLRDFPAIPALTLTRSAEASSTRPSPRQLLPFSWLKVTYSPAARDESQAGSGDQRRPQLTDLAFCGLLVYAIWTGQRIPKEYDYETSRYFQFVNDNVPSVREVAEWLEQNVPSQAVLAANATNIRGLEFFTNGKYTIQRYFSMPAEQSSIDWPYQSSVSLEEEHGLLQFYGLSAANNDYHVHVSKPMYIQNGWVQTRKAAGDIRYATLSERQLLDFVRDLKIDYLILTEGLTYHSLHLIPDYFEDHPAFQHVYFTRWQQGSRDYAIHIFHVDRSSLDEADYPVLVPSHIWPTLLQDAASPSSDIYHLIEAFGGGPIVFRPASVDNAKLYEQVAEAYAANGDFDLAAFEYHLALSEAPKRALSLAATARSLTSQHPNSAGSWLLLGDVYYIQGDIELAQEAYQRAIEAPQGSQYTYGAATRELGNLCFAAGQYSEAIDWFEASMRLSTFGATEARSQMLLARANLLQVAGELDQAIILYGQALDGSYSSVLDQEYIAVSNLVYEFDKFKASDMTATVRPNVLIMGNDLHLALFAHPPTEVSYLLHTPSRAVLQFAPILAPEVWQLGKGDGVQFDVYIDNGRSRERVFTRYTDPKNILADRSWQDYQVDLSPWAGEVITVSLSTTCGKNDNCQHDWANWGELRLLQPVAYNFLDHFSEAEQGLQESGDVRVITETINYESRPLLLQHPTSQVAYSLTLPLRSTLCFGYGMDPAVWSPDKGDGVEYNIYVSLAEEPSKLYRVFHDYIDPKNNPEDRRWFDERVDLSQFGGQAVKIIFEALPGPAGDDSYDWGGWSWPVLVDETPADSTRTKPKDSTGTP
jgi:4-amino-4-deoxy-L-arabinose transferase-like glycosyltransferase/tetratricopeptide (TPR) repeat protein